MNPMHRSSNQCVCVRAFTQILMHVKGSQPLEKSLQHGKKMKKHTVKWNLRKTEVIQEAEENFK